MNAADIERIVQEAARLLLEHHPTLFLFTSQTNQTEWNIAHHLAVELAELFDDYDCDVDVSKPNLDLRRPDIIIHQRGIHQRNLLVIEVKRSRDDVDADVEKIRRWWFREELRYQFGAVVVVNEHEPVQVTMLENEAWG